MMNLQQLLINGMEWSVVIGVACSILAALFYILTGIKYLIIWSVTDLLDSICNVLDARADYWRMMKRDAHDKANYISQQVQAVQERNTCYVDDRVYHLHIYNGDDLVDWVVWRPSSFLKGT